MIVICDRRVKVQTGQKTQTVNVCTIANTIGAYDYIIRMSKPHFVTEPELQAQSFEQIEDLVKYLRIQGAIKSCQQEKTPFEMC